MRLLVVLFAVMGLLANPVSAAAAQAACSQAMSSASMSGMAMPGMQQSGAMTSKPACCDYSKGHPAKSCAQLCAAICAVDAAFGGPSVSAPFAMAAAELAPAPVPSVHSFEPAGAERPPKPIA